MEKKKMGFRGLTFQVIVTSNRLQRQPEVEASYFNTGAGQLIFNPGRSIAVFFTGFSFQLGLNNKIKENEKIYNNYCDSV